MNSTNFVVGNNASFVYGGIVRSGRIDRVTDSVVTIFCTLRNAFRSFRLDRIERLA